MMMMMMIVMVMVMVDDEEGKWWGSKTGTLKEGNYNNDNERQGMIV